MFTGDLSRRGVTALALLAAPAVTYAQSQVFGQDIGQELREQTATAPVIVTEISGSAEHHSNLFRLGEGVDPSPLYGKSQRSDTIFRAGLGIRFDREVSLQRFTADARIEPTKYKTYSNFDNVGYNVGGVWNWSLGRPLFGRIGARFSQAQTSFLVATSLDPVEKNQQKRNNYFATAGFRITPDWAVVGGVDLTTQDNSASRYQSANYKFTSAEGGVRYAPGTGTELEFVWRNTRGKYDALQTFDYARNVLPTAVDNSFKQNALLARLQYRPSEDTQFSGELGYTKRTYDSLGSRDFSGPTAKAEIYWRPSGAFYLRGTVFRDIANNELLTSNYIDAVGFRLYPSIVLTGKITLQGVVSYANYTYKGDPGIGITSGTVRKDDITVLGAGLLYDYSNLLAFTLNAATERRDANVAGVKSTNNTLLVGARVRF